MTPNTNRSSATQSPSTRGTPSNRPDEQDNEMKRKGAMGDECGCPGYRDDDAGRTGAKQSPGTTRRDESIQDDPDSDGDEATISSETDSAGEDDQANRQSTKRSGDASTSRDRGDPRANRNERQPDTTKP